MRRLAAAGVLVLCALFGTACSSGSGRNTATGTAASASPGPGASPSPSEAPYAANTHQVCGSLNQVIATGASTIGTDLGTAVGHVAGGNSTEADKAKAAALTHIKSLATDIRTAAQPAQTQVLQQAADGAASNLETLAADPSLLVGLKSGSDVTPVLEKVTGATATLAKACV
jgi:hypothetical protein